MPLGIEVGLGPGHIVLDGEPATPPRKGAKQPPTFRHMSMLVVQGSWLLGRGYNLPSCACCTDAGRPASRL